MIGRKQLMRPPKLQDDLLRAALCPDRSVAEESARNWSQAVDLDTLDFASMQLLPMLTAREDPLPLGDRLTGQVKEVARFTWLRTESYARLAAPTIAALREAGCDPVLMKGAALVYGHGVPARLRPMFDIDVLVDPDRIAAAARVLIEHGYAARDQEGLLAAEPRLLALKHGEEFARAGNQSIDLHWAALHTMRRPELAASLRANAVPCSIAGAECRSLGRTDLLSVTIAHASDPWRDLRERWVGDCVLLVRGHEEEIDWELLAARGRDWRLSQQILSAFDYLDDVADVQLPADTRKQLERDPVPLAVRQRAYRRRSPDGTPTVTGSVARALEDYEMEIADLVPLGDRTGAGDYLDFLVRRRGVERRSQLPGDFLFAAAGRPWRVRRKLRGLAGRSAAPGEEAPDWPRYELGEQLRFSGAKPRTECLATGWWFPEDFGIWSRGRHSVVRLGLSKPIEGGAELTFGIRAPLAERHPSITVDVVVNQFRLARIVLDHETPTSSPVLAVPPEALAGARRVEIDFIVDRPAVPAELGTAPDLREIGLGLGELTLSV